MNNTYSICFFCRSLTVREENRPISLPKQAIVVSVMFLIAGLFSAIPFLYLIPQMPSLLIARIWEVAFVIVGWFLPFVLFFVCLGITVNQLRGNYHRNSYGDDAQMFSRNLAKKRQVFMVIIMTVPFLVLTIPVEINELLYLFLPWNTISTKAIPWLFCLSFVNSFVKPIVYAVMRPARQWRDGQEAVQPTPDAPLIDDGAAAETCH